MEFCKEPNREQKLEVPLDPMLWSDGLSEVRDMIFASLPLTDLMSCAQVSHLWREKVAVLLSNRKCCAYVTGTCRNICELNSLLDKLLLKTTDISVINGLKIHVPSEHTYCLGYMKEKERKILSWYFQMLQLRSLDLLVSSCPASRHLMQEILLGSSNTVEELTLTYDCDADGEVIPCNTKLEFPKLKAIHIQRPFNWVEYDVFRLISLSPNLKTVSGLCWLRDFTRSHSTRLDVFTGICVLPKERDYEVLKLLTDADSRVKELQIFDSKKGSITRAWHPLLLKIFKRNTFQLTHLSICAYVLLQLRRKSFRLEVLDHLTLFFPDHSTLDEVRHAIAGLRLQVSCPRLKSMQLNFTEDCSHKTPTSLFASSVGFVPITSVREITTEMAICTPAVISACIHAFPLLSSFAFEAIRCAEICEAFDDDHFFEVHKIWTEIPTLEMLSICVCGTQITPPNFSLDALFCGLNKDETKYIRACRKENYLDLTAFQHCPARPSILWAKNLKSLKLVFAPKYDLKTVPMSDVSFHLAFRHVPTVSIKFELHCPAFSNEFSHLAQFAEIATFTDGRDWW